MKTKFIRSGKSNRRELVVAVQRGEALDEKRAKTLAGCTSSLLLPFSYETQRVGTILHYDVEGLWSLRTFLAKRSMGTDELLGLMHAVQHLFDLCGELRLRAEGLIFDPEFVFVNACCSPRFVMVPLEEQPFTERNSPLALLRAIGNDEALRFTSPDAKGLSRRLGSFVVDQADVFSSNAFKRFVEAEEHGADEPAQVPEPRLTVTEPEEGSAWATAGGAKPPASASSGTLFWSPLSGLVADENEKPAQEQVQAPVPVVVQTPAPVAAPEPKPVLTPMPERTSTPTPAPVSASVPMPVPVPAPTPEKKAFLVRVSTGEQHSIPIGAEVRVGRGSACGIRLLGNPKLSRVHASVVFDGQQVFVTDLGAANGVWVNGVRLGAQQTMATGFGQQFRLADEVLFVHAV